MAQKPTEDTMKWIRRGSAGAVLVIGWVFILFANKFHVTTPVVFVCLGYFAAVAAIYTLFRTGATAVAAYDDDDPTSWGSPLGFLGELEREKRTLLKAIKEAEFDQQMGKLSKADADSMIAIYRARAIEVIKEIDIANSATGTAGTVRERILREARARIAVDTKAAETAPASKKAKGDSKQQKRADKLAAAVSGVATKAETPEAKAEVEADKSGDDVITKPEVKPNTDDVETKPEVKPPVASDPTADATPEPTPEPKSERKKEAAP